MVRRLVLLNLLLAAIVVAGVVRLRRDMAIFSSDHQVSLITPASEKPLPKAADVLVLPAKQEWSEIATRNPFSFDRNDVPLVITPPTPLQPRRPKPILFGTMLLGSDRLAMLAVGDAPKSSSRPVRVGETFDGWTLIEIQNEAVTVQWDQTKESLKVNEVQVARDYSKTVGADVNLAPVNVNSPQPAAAPQQPAQLPPNAVPAPTSNNGRRQIVVQTPFGPKTMDDPSQK
jgi:hypothetical protein